jgi:hypothetical protein
MTKAQFVTVPSLFGIKTSEQGMLGGLRPDFSATARFLNGH